MLIILSLSKNNQHFRMISFIFLKIFLSFSNGTIVASVDNAKKTLARVFNNRVDSVESRCQQTRRRLISNYSCRQCGKSFSTLSELSAHSIRRKYAAKVQTKTSCSSRIEPQFGEVGLLSQKIL